MSDREPRLLRVEVDEYGQPWARDITCKLVPLARDTGLFRPHPDDLLPLPEPRSEDEFWHHLMVQSWEAAEPAPGFASPEDARDRVLALVSPQPCTLGCTVECPECLGAHIGTPPVCPVCSDSGTVPATHATEDECRPPPPEGYYISQVDDGVTFMWSVIRPNRTPHRMGWEPSEADRDRALGAAVRDIVRQHADNGEEQP